MDTRERVARAICIEEGLPEDIWEGYVHTANAAIEAMLRTKAPEPKNLWSGHATYHTAWHAGIAAYRKAIRGKK